MKKILNYLLFILREKVSDVSNNVIWTNETMYDDENIVNYYDTKNSIEKISTFNSSAELEFIDMMRYYKLKSVLDLGCSSGAFYHLCSSVFPKIYYKGFDKSAIQIKNAKNNFGNHFEQRDINSIPMEVFKNFDCIHIYSVFSFMSAAEQLDMLKKLVELNMNFILETNVTLKDVNYAPTSCFKQFSKKKNKDGIILYDTISFSFLQDVKNILNETNYHLEIKQTEYSVSHFLNNSKKSGGGLYKY